MKNYRHWAICPETGEVLSSCTGNALRRHVERNVAWDRANGYPPKKWRFFHGTQEGLRKKSFA